MKLLLDANLSWRMAARLKDHFTDCLDVDHIGLDIPASEHFPPKVVLLRTGNQSNSYIQQLLIKHISDIEALANSAEIGLLEIF